MVSVCSSCRGLHKHTKAVDRVDEQDSAFAVQWVNTRLPSLRHASETCRACALLLQGVLLHHDRFAGIDEQSVRIVAESFQSSPGKEAQDHLSVDIWWKELSEACCDGTEHDHEDGYPDLKLEFFTDRDGKSSYSAIGQGRHITDEFLQDVGIQNSRSMLGACLANHPRCRPLKPTSLPRRVLDVLTDDESRKVRLHESELIDDQRFEFGEYLALSYCWGTGRGIPQTTTKTLQSHKKGISWASLPRAFQEAILLTRSRGFRWLWVDSLCIVQDDPTEKLQESLRLDEIFGNAFVTIAATSSADPGRGLFPPRLPPFKIQATDSKGSLSKIYVREQPSHYSFKAPFDEGAHMNDWELPFNASREANLHTPLLRRAWAYIERLLSPRVMHFTDSEMILECKEAYQCECGRIDDPTYDSRTTDCVKQEFARVVAESGIHEESTNGNEDDRQISGVMSQLATASIDDAAHHMFKKRDEALQLWSYIITEYTSRNLTYEADRLVAIAAVAKMLTEAASSGYIAGQWTCNVLGLLWYPSEGTQCHRPKQHFGNNVPSWSWASIEGSPLFFDNSSAMDLACSVSFPAERTNANIFSPTSGDTLELTASMATDVTLRIESDEEYSLVRNGISVDFRPDVVPLRVEDSLHSGEKLTCVLVSMTFRSSIIGLVLKQSRTDAQQYRRIGRFECYECQKDDSDEEPEDAESLFEHWFPEIEDMTQLDDGPQRTFIVV